MMDQLMTVSGKVKNDIGKRLTWNIYRKGITEVGFSEVVALVALYRDTLGGYDDGSAYS